jgi:photosystem II stability/assembly factor-like uncharacterized protein
VTCLVPDPQLPQVAYACTSNDGVHRVVANTLGVGDLSTGMAAHSTVRAIATDPSQRGAVYAATSTGLYMSTSAGDSWTPLNSPPGKSAMSALAVSPGLGTMLIGTGSGGILFSHDKGARWYEASQELTLGHAVTQMLWDEPGHAALALTDDGAIYRSTDAGDTWQVQSDGIDQGTQARALALAGTNMYAGASTGLFASTDGGQRWAKLRLPLTGDIGAVGVSGDGTAVLAASGARVIVSRDAGQTWASVGSPTGAVVGLVTQLEDANHQPVTIAETSALLRYPGLGGTAPPGLSLLLGVLLLVAVGYFVIRVRSGRRVFGGRRPAREARGTQSATDTADARPPSQRFDHGG